MSNLLTALILCSQLSTGRLEQQDILYFRWVIVTMPQSGSHSAFENVCLHKNMLPDDGRIVLLPKFIEVVVIDFWPCKPCPSATVWPEVETRGNSNCLSLHLSILFSSYFSLSHLCSSPLLACSLSLQNNRKAHQQMKQWNWGTHYDVTLVCAVSN